MVQHSIRQLHSNVLFLFLCIFNGYFKSHDKHWSMYFQNHPGMKYVHKGFCPTFAEIPSVSSGIPPCWDRIKNVLASYKYNMSIIKKWQYTYHPGIVSTASYPVPSLRISPQPPPNPSISGRIPHLMDESLI